MRAALPVLLVVGIVLNGLRLRRRVSQLHTLPEPDGEPDAELGALVAETVTLDDATAASAATFARAGLIELVELVPADLCTAPALDLVRLVDPVAWRADPFASGHGAGQAVMATNRLLERAGIAPARGLTTKDLVEMGAKLKAYAARSADIAVAPSLQAARYDPKARGAHLRAAGVPVGPAVVLPMAIYGLLVAATIMRPVWGIVAFAVYSLQPYLILAGGPLSPPDLGRASVLRVVREPLAWIRTLGGGKPGADPEEAERFAATRAEYARDLEEGTGRFFEARRSSCPWCEGDDLRKILATGDRFQKKPGRFTLEECRSCGHVFQNPACPSRASSSTTGTSTTGTAARRWSGCSAPEPTPIASGRRRPGPTVCPDAGSMWERGTPTSASSLVTCGPTPRSTGSTWASPSRRRSARAGSAMATEASSVTWPRSWPGATTSSACITISSTPATHAPSWMRRRASSSTVDSS